MKYTVIYFVRGYDKSRSMITTNHKHLILKNGETFKEMLDREQIREPQMFFKGHIKLAVIPSYKMK